MFGQTKMLKVLQVLELYCIALLLMMHPSHSIIVQTDATKLKITEKYISYAPRWI